MPPPNVSGKLHLGHFLNLTLADFFVRVRKVFFGDDAKIIPGYDHGGISTAVAALKNIKDCKAEEKGELIRIFAEQSKEYIRSQFKKFNLIIDFDYEQYTLDDFYAQLVEKYFLKFKSMGLIYKSRGLVNYDSLLGTAVADLEVSHVLKKSKLYYLNYLLEKGGSIKVATSRPETIFADAALAIHPEDEKYKNLTSKYAYIPIINKKIPIIKTELVDKNFGTGVLKITPAHDLLDKEIGESFSLISINIISEGKLNFKELIEQNPDYFHIKEIKEFENLKITEAREKIVELLKLEFSIIDQKVPINEKSGGLIEYCLQEDWFFDMKKAARLALEKQPCFVPELWKNNYENWLKNIKPWCISRSISWGHKIPDDSKVLDTWFSSALWPIAYKEKFGIFPTSLLVTAYDIIFFWVARMNMLSLLLEEEIPFKTIFIHDLIRDSHGKKMSKTHGNVQDPFELIEKYGTDCCRLALLRTVSPNSNITYSEQAILDSRKVITKLINLANYINKTSDTINNIPNEQKQKKKKKSMADSEKTKELDSTMKLAEYFLNRTKQTLEKYKKFSENYEIHQICQMILNFLYEICDELVEYTKVRKELLLTLKNIFSHILLMFYPFIPKTTEDLGVFDSIFDLKDMKDNQLSNDVGLKLAVAISNMRRNIQKNDSPSEIDPELYEYKDIFKKLLKLDF